jgi:hypothetical protein
MIFLNRNELVEIFQVELTLKKKVKQSPFISILILAQELGSITAESLNQNLLKTIPIRACENLLKRLEQQRYLRKVDPDFFNIEGKFQGEYGNYYLTEFGEDGATNKSFFIGEKGIYNVYVNSNLFENNFSKYHILEIEISKVTNDNRAINTPRFITEYQGLPLLINGNEYIIEDVERMCFQHKSTECIMELQSNGSGTELKIKNKSQNIFESVLEIHENELRAELLSHCTEFEYNKDKNAIKTTFDKSNLTFIRNAKISQPYFQGYYFKPIEIENVQHIPFDVINAQIWYLEILFRNLDQYFLDDAAFREYALKLASPIQTHYQLVVPSRSEFIEEIKKSDNAFYQISKLHTIDFLNYY